MALTRLDRVAMTDVDMGHARAAQESVPGMGPVRAPGIGPGMTRADTREVVAATMPVIGPSEIRRARTTLMQGRGPAIGVGPGGVPGMTPRDVPVTAPDMTRIVAPETVRDMTRTAVPAIVLAETPPGVRASGLDVIPATWALGNAHGTTPVGARARVRGMHRTGIRAVICGTSRVTGVLGSVVGTIPAVVRETVPGTTRVTEVLGIVPGTIPAVVRQTAPGTTRVTRAPATARGTTRVTRVLGIVPGTTPAVVLATAPGMTRVTRAPATARGTTRVTRAVATARGTTHATRVRRIVPGTSPGTATPVSAAVAGVSTGGMIAVSIPRNPMRAANGRRRPRGWSVRRTSRRFPRSIRARFRVRSGPNCGV